MITKPIVAVLGGGSFGTVISNLAASNGYEVKLWVRDAEQALRINAEGANSDYHPELKLSSNITATDSLEVCIKGATLVFVVTPSIVFENVIQRLTALVTSDMVIISCTKAIASNPTRTLSEIMQIYLGNRVKGFGVLSGPNLAKEIADNKIAGTVIASNDKEVSELVSQVISSHSFKVYSSSDMKGIEYAGALKNIYAICCGIAEAQDLGENALGLILTRSMAEMSDFAVHQGANPLTFLGLAGMGDLVATCTSRLSRNFSLGFYLGQGFSLDEAKAKVGQVAEGLRTLSVIHDELPNLKVEMPLLVSLYQIIYEEKKPTFLIENLINHVNNVDVEFKLDYGKN
ncbi:MAG: NAD(P)H-dependent glycerol-3-phosphate dehydrogenase [Gammaproteobacteria bacterium]